ncbi:MAG: hypothetical protein IJ438_00640 [Clostridia bacterium]|nr:hypothetical protein [Clostridia bacterium]
MQDENKKQPPYKGFAILCIMLVSVPAVLYAVTLAVLQTYQPSSNGLDEATARAIGLGLGMLFHLSCWVAGAFRDSFAVVKFRVSEFFENIAGGLGFALVCYWDDIKSDGVVFLACFLIMATNAVLCVDGWLTCGRLLNAW